MLYLLWKTTTLGATLQTIIDRGYENLFYQEKNHLIVDEDIQHTNKYRSIDRNKIPKALLQQ